MEILSIITERPDRLAAHDVGRLPTKRLEHRQKQLQQRGRSTWTAHYGGQRWKRKKKKKEKAEKCHEPLVDYEWVYGSTCDSGFSRLCDSLRSGYMKPILILDWSQFVYRGSSQIQTCIKENKPPWLNDSGFMYGTLCLLQRGQDECGPVPTRSQQRMSTVKTHNAESALSYQLARKTTTRNRK